MPPRRSFQFRDIPRPDLIKQGGEQLRLLLRRMGCLGATLDAGPALAQQAGVVAWEHR